MIQVLDRATKILEIVSSNPQKHWSLSELSDGIGLHRATCANIVKSLLELNFLQKLDSPKGYTLGNKVYALSNWQESALSPFYRLVDSLRTELNEGVVLSVIRNGRRVFLHQAYCTHELQVRVKESASVYAVTTAKVIIANYSADEIQEFIERYGLPGLEWEEIYSKDILLKTLSKIREQPFLETISVNHVIALAAPIFYDGKAIASIGIYLPDVRYTEDVRDNIRQRLMDTALTINQAMQNR